MFLTEPVLPALVPPTAFLETVAAATAAAAAVATAIPPLELAAVVAGDGVCVDALAATAVLVACEEAACSLFALAACCRSAAWAVCVRKEASRLERKNGRCGGAMFDVLDVDMVVAIRGVD